MIQKIVPFYGDQLQAVQDDAGEIWAPLAPMCRALGLDDHSQRQRLKRCGWATWRNVSPPGRDGPGSSNSATLGFSVDGKDRELFCLRLRSIPMWLPTIYVSRVAVVL